MARLPLRWVVMLLEESVFAETETKTGKRIKTGDAVPPGTLDLRGGTTEEAYRKMQGLFGGSQF